MSLSINKTTTSRYPLYLSSRNSFPMDKLKARLVADGSQKGRHLYDLVSSATVSLQVVYLLFNIAS